MPEVTLKINNRGYGLACDPGQEQRIADLGHYVDSRLQDIAKAGAATNDAHLLVLTSLVLADEIYELREQVANLRNGVAAPAKDPQEEEILVRAIEHIAARVQNLNERIQQAEQSARAA
ncbi:MAG: cell division protein ZapA [Alphaproteobacteria bacterium]|nr:cell division protein ZapA [Alphaproteobacteria bacterium]